MAANPFTNRVMIKEPTAFIGRTSQLEFVVERLKTMQSCSVVGAWRIGRSSLLYHICEAGTELLEDENYHFLFIELTDAYAQTGVDLLQTILRKLNCPTDGIKDDNKLSRNLAAFDKEIAVLEEIGDRVVLCLDEFEAFFDNATEFNMTFFNHIRTMVNDRRLALVTASLMPLETYSLERKLPAKFFNSFGIVELTEFTDEEVEQFIAIHHQQVNFTEKEIQFINSYLDPHPLKLQILCDQVIQNRSRQWRYELLIEEVVRVYGQHLGGKYELKNLRKAKAYVSLDSISKVLANLKTARDLFTGK